MTVVTRPGGETRLVLGDVYVSWPRWACLATTVVISGTWSGGITLMDAVVNQLKIDVHRRRVCLLAYFPAQAFAAS